MPIFDEHSNPYEILIRFDPETGLLKGAHQIRINIVTRDGVVIQAQEGDAQPVNLQDFAASDLMSETLEAALQANSHLQSDLAVANEQLSALNNNVAQLQSEKEALAAQVEGLQAQLATAETPT